MLEKSLALWLPSHEKLGLYKTATIEGRGIYDPAPAGAATCHLSYALEGSNQIRMYDIYFGAPHDNGVGCAETLVALQPVTKTDIWRCDVLIESNNNTRLYFAADPVAANDIVASEQQHAAIVQILQERYPDLPFQTAGYCSLPNGNARRDLRSKQYRDNARALDVRDAVAPNNADCHVEAPSTLWPPKEIYHVQIGRPWVPGGPCDYVGDTLVEFVESVGATIMDYTCEDDHTGGTQLTFATSAINRPDVSIQIVSGLQKVYPDVPFEKDRICLMGGVDPPWT